MSKYDKDQAHKNHGYCGGLNENAPTRLIGSGTIRSWDFVGVDVVLLEEV